MKRIRLGLILLLAAARVSADSACAEAVLAGAFSAGGYGELKQDLAAREKSTVYCFGDESITGFVEAFREPDTRHALRQMYEQALEPNPSTTRVFAGTAPSGWKPTSRPVENVDRFAELIRVQTRLAVSTEEIGLLGTEEFVNYETTVYHVRAEIHWVYHPAMGHGLRKLKLTYQRK